MLALSVFIHAGAVQAHAGDHRSIAELDAIIKRAPGEASLLVARGALYSRSGQWDKAERDLSLAQSLGNKKDVAFEFGQFYYRRGEYQKALAHIDTYISAYPTYPAAFLLRARAASKVKQFDIARKSYLTYFGFSANTQPGEYLAASRLLASATSGGITSALALLDEAINELGLNPQLQRFAMELELRRGGTESALDRWCSLKDQLGKTPEWGITLARILILAGRYDQARLAVQASKARLVLLRQTPARKVAGETLSRLKRQLIEQPYNNKANNR